METARRPRVSLYTLGCKVNQYETREAAADLLRLGYHVVPFDAFDDQGNILLPNGLPVPADWTTAVGQVYDAREEWSEAQTCCRSPNSSTSR